MSWKVKKWREYKERVNLWGGERNYKVRIIIWIWNVVWYKIWKDRLRK